MIVVILVILTVLILYKLIINAYYSSVEPIKFIESTGTNSINTTRMCWSDKMTTSERAILKRLLIVVDGILKNAGVKWMPTGGSLLSIYRINRLFLKWDDDYDMTVENSKTIVAINALKEELPKHNAILLGPTKWGGGDLYRIGFKDSEPGVTRTPHKKDHTWPLMDLFINVPFRKSNFFPYNITTEEVNSLETRVVDGVEITVPTVGNRTEKAFKEDGHIDLCIEQEFNHKHGRKESCIGEKEKKCSEIYMYY